MTYAKVFERSPMRAFEHSIHGGPAAGEVCAVIGRAGVGKSALLVHLALDRLFQGQRVLHISLREGADSVRNFYNEIFGSLARVSRLTGRERDQALILVEQNRQIQCYLDRNFGVDDLEKSLRFVVDVMHFQPSLVVLDGFSPSSSNDVAALSKLARDNGFSVWGSVREAADGGAPHEDAWSTIVALDPVDTIIELRARKVHGEAMQEPMGLQLEPNTMLLVGEETWDPMSAPPSPRAEECTLYSGGATGAEAIFGEAAERYNVKEVNFTFEGHRQLRDRGSYTLSERELAAGDVSLVYVSNRLHRTYSEGTMIRRVLQSLWHQVSRSQQVFVIGSIQDDGTVTGGTGWSVELARMWHKDLWVYDQEKESWFHWIGERWVAGVPVIESPHFCGTGTRYLTDKGQVAVKNLFDRSFGNAS